MFYIVLVRGTMRRRSWNRAERREERVDEGRDAVVREVPGSRPVEALEDEKADLEPHPTANVKPV